MTAQTPERGALASPSPDRPAVAAYAVHYELEEDAAAVEWRFITEGERVKWRAVAGAAVEAGGWDALAAEIESLSPGDGVTVGSTILTRVCRAVAARLTGTRPQGEASVWIDDEGDGDARVTVAWGAPREAEKAARGE